MFFRNWKRPGPLTDENYRLELYNNFCMLFLYSLNATATSFSLSYLQIPYVHLFLLCASSLENWTICCKLLTNQKVLWYKCKKWFNGLTFGLWQSLAWCFDPSRGYQSLAAKQAPSLYSPFFSFFIVCPLFFLCAFCLYLFSFVSTLLLLLHQYTCLCVLRCH